MTRLANKVEAIADLIFNELDRLGCSTNQDACSGLMTGDPNCFDYHNPDQILVKIYDDHFSGIYDGEAVLETLRSTEFATLQSDEPGNIWQLIASVEA